MPNSGQARKQKRRALRKVEVELAHSSEGDWAGDDADNLRLLAERARWQTAEPQSDKPVDEMSAKEIAILATTKAMLSGDPKVATAAVKNLVLMEAQNQRDEESQRPAFHLHAHNNTNTVEHHDGSREAVAAIVARLGAPRAAARHLARET